MQHYYYCFLTTGTYNPKGEPLKIEKFNLNVYLKIEQ